MGDRLAATQRQCTAAAKLATMPDSERELAEAALTNDPASPARRSTEQVAAAMRAEGYPVAATTLDRHRKGRCCCDHR
jgi:hypothetical protein